jgi:hypothetical protein
VGIKSSQWRKNQQNHFDEIKRKTSQAPVFTLLNLQNLFKVDTYESGNSMGAVMMQEGRPICYHSKYFHGVVINYPNYDKDIYALVQDVKK